MKKNTSYLISLATFLLLIFSCKSQEEEIVLTDYEIKKANIVGEWIMKRSTQEFRADTLYSEYGSPFDVTYVFSKNGTGYSKFLSFENNFEWLLQNDPPQIALKDIFFLASTIYDITKNEQDRQIWEHQENKTDSTGMEIHLKHTLKFSRE